MKQSLFFIPLTLLIASATHAADDQVKEKIPQELCENSEFKAAIAGLKRKLAQCETEHKLGKRIKGAYYFNEGFGDMLELHGAFEDTVATFARQDVTYLGPDTEPPYHK